jgi:rhomboid protease GluP
VSDLENRGLNIPSITGMRMPGTVRMVWVLIGINVAIFVLAQVVALFLADDPFCRPSPYTCALIVLGWQQNELIVTQGEYWRLITSTFLHSGLMHLFANSFGLFILGPDTERIYGMWRFLAVYLLAGLTGSVMSYILLPNPTLGASGSVFGLFGALIVFLYITRDVLGAFGRTQLQGIGAMLAIGLVLGFTDPTVNNIGHVGGLVGGAVASWFLAPRYRAEGGAFARTIVRRSSPRDWLGAAGLLAVLAVLVLLLPPAL